MQKYVPYIVDYIFEGFFSALRSIKTNQQNKPTLETDLWVTVWQPWINIL